MRMIKEVLRLHYACGLSHKKISAALGCSHGSVADYIHRAQAAGLTWPLPDELDDQQLETKLYPPVLVKSASRAQPDCVYIYQELKRKGVTLVQLWAEYRQDFPDGYGQTQFCDIYRSFAKNVNISMRQTHKAGHKAFSDFAGKTLPISLFVLLVPAASPSRNCSMMKLPSPGATDMQKRLGTLMALPKS